MTQHTDPSVPNAELVLKFLDLLDRHEFEAAEALLSPGFVLHLNDRELNREQTMAMVRGVYEAFADFRHDVQETLAIGDRVVVRIVDRATHTGTFEGIPATGRQIGIGQISIARIADGTIVEIREVADLLSLMQQIGAIPAHSA